MELEKGSLFKKGEAIEAYKFNGGVTENYEKNYKIILGIYSFGELIKRFITVYSLSIQKKGSFLTEKEENKLYEDMININEIIEKIVNHDFFDFIKDYNKYEKKIIEFENRPIYILSMNEFENSEMLKNDNKYEFEVFRHKLLLYNLNAFFLIINMINKDIYLAEYQNKSFVVLENDCELNEKNPIENAWLFNDELFEKINSIDINENNEEMFNILEIAKKQIDLYDFYIKPYLKTLFSF
jgi:hypothetical protein